MSYWMYDTRGRGDSGGMTMNLWQDGNEVKHDVGQRPRVGCAVRVGSVTARSYQHQDWWQTTPIKEILEDTPNKVVFKTLSGSIYTWICD